MIFIHLHPAAMLVLFQSTQLNLFERFLTQARAGIDSTGVTSGMQKVAYAVLLIGFLWQVYQSAIHGGDVRGLGTSLIKYVVTAVVVMNFYGVFTTINQAFVNAGNWVNSASGFADLFQNWSADLKTQFNQVGFQKMWGLITGDLPGLIDALLILVAYLFYPIVIVVFGFFYIFYGSILYIFGPIVIALMPLDGANRLAKSYVENVFIWNAWPVLYGGFGALLNAVQMGQLGQMLNQNNFLGGLGNLEGSILIGIVSIIYSLAIAIIPFVARRIVSGDVGNTAAAMVGAAVTALTAGTAGIEGAAAGVAAARAGSTGAASSGVASGTAIAGSARALPASTSGNLPAPPQRTPIAASSATNGFEFNSRAPTLEGHAEQIRNSISRAMGTDNVGEIESGAGAVSVESSGGSKSNSGSSAARTTTGGGAAKRGPTVHRYNIGTWGVYHAARIAASSIVNAAQHSAGNESEGS
jgi:hypothetical protein